MPDHALITADVYSITPSTNKVGIYLLYFTFCAAAAAELLRSCPSLGYTLDCSLPGSSVRGILQAIILEWVAISFTKGSSRPRDRTQVSCTASRFFTV